MKDIKNKIYENQLITLLNKNYVKTPTVERATPELLQTIAVMLKEKDPIFARDIAKEFINIFNFGETYIAEKITSIVRLKGKDYGVRTISLENALQEVYKQPIYKITRPTKSKKQKLFKNSQLLYSNESSLIRYLKENTSTKLTVFFN